LGNVAGQSLFHPSKLTQELDFGGNFHLHCTDLKVRRLLVRANVVPSSPILVTRMIEAIGSSETLVITRAAWRNIADDGILRIGLYRRLIFHLINYVVSSIGWLGTQMENLLL
jgi:hypothetical protein